MATGDVPRNGGGGSREEAEDDDEEEKEDDDDDVVNGLVGSESPDEEGTGTSESHLLGRYLEDATTRLLDNRGRLACLGVD